MIRILSHMKILKEDNKPILITDNLYISSFAPAYNKETLESHNISHIVVAAAGLVKKFPENFTYLQLTLLDSPQEDIKKYFDETGKFIHECISNNGTALVHCHAGISRSSTIIIAYLMKYKKMKFQEALSFSKNKREKINPNSGMN
jgi:protein-tyrosine phosphatase